MSKTKFVFIFLLSPWMIWPQVVHSSVFKVNFSEGLNLQVPRWILVSDQPEYSPGMLGEFQKVKVYQKKKQYTKCLSVLGGLLAQASDLGDWISYNQLSCALKQYKKNRSSVSVKVIKEVTQRIKKNEKWLYQETTNAVLFPFYVEALFTQLEYENAHGRDNSWTLVGELLSLKGRMQSTQRSRLFRLAGELAFAQQRPYVAQDYFARSLSQNENKKLRKRFESLQKAFKPERRIVLNEPSSVTASQEALEVSEGELALYNRIRKDLKLGHLMAAIEDGLVLLEKYPGGRRAQWTQDRIFDVLWKIVKAPKEKYALLRRSLMVKLKSASGERLYAWGEKLFSRGRYEYSIKLGQLALKKLDENSLKGKTQLFTGLSAIYLGKYSLAQNLLTDLSNEFSGSKIGYEALFRLGLVYFRDQKYSKASSAFEKYLAAGRYDDFKLLSMYWLWRSLSKENRVKAKKVALRLIEEYPLTYYGLRTRAELNDGVLVWDIPDKKIDPVESWLTRWERLSWEKIQILIQGGWFIEARREMETLPQSKQLEQRILKAKLMGMTMDHHSAIVLINAVWDEYNQIDLYSPSNIRISYPLEYQDSVEAEAKRYNTDKSLINGLIKQESSFRLRATSVSNALGLMQLIPSTAREVGKYLRWKSMRLPEDLFQPKTNIRFGTYYLKRLTRAFKGHVPLALASYNVGIGNMRRWMSRRPELKQLESSLTWDPSSEIWIDELPWDETRYYVKAVLRNFLIYKMLSEKSVNLSQPIWLSNSVTAAR